MLAAQGKKAEAAASYKAALAALDKAPKSNGANPHGQYRDMLQAKLDSLGSRQVKTMQRISALCLMVSLAACCSLP